MLHKPETSDQQGVRDFLTEGVTTLSAIEMNRVLDNCGYEHQRKVTERHVMVLADLMKRGRWQAKSQIDFAVLNGRYILINGYHRAYAQVRSGKGIAWSIALHPVKTEADLRSLYYAFDTNLRVRGARDILAATEFGQQHGLNDDMAKSLYAAVPMIARRFSTNHYDADVLINSQVDLRLGFAAEYAKAAARYAACLDGVPMRRKRKFLVGGITAVAVTTFRYQSETAWTFWTGVAQMENLSRGDARLTLASDFMTRPVASGAVAVIAPSIIAWNAFFNERELRIIKVTEHFVPAIYGTPFDGKPVKGKSITPNMVAA